VQITRSRATRRAIPEGPRPLARLHVLAGDQRQQRHRLDLLGAQLGVATAASTASASLTSPDTNACLASESSQSQSGLPGRS
jgi:hypothetical protein